MREPKSGPQAAASADADQGSKDPKTMDLFASLDASQKATAAAQAGTEQNATEPTVEAESSAEPQEEEDDTVKSINDALRGLFR